MVRMILSPGRRREAVRHAAARRRIDPPSFRAKEVPRISSVSSDVRTMSLTMIPSSPSFASARKTRA